MKVVKDKTYIENFTWAPRKGFGYIVRTETEEFNYYNISCFASLSKTNAKEIIDIYMVFPICKKSKKYYDFYLHYIADMFQLKEVEITENSFKFKAFPNYIKNLSVLSTIRFLYEHIGSTVSPEKTLKFLDDLQYKKCKYTSKFERFCYLYREIGNYEYFHDAHSWKPSKTKIRTYEEFNEMKNNICSVNKFFTYV